MAQTRPDYILSNHWKEWVQDSAVNPAIVAQCVTSSGAKNLIPSRIAEKLNWKRSQAWMKTGWLVQGLDPRTGQPCSAYQFKPESPRVKDGKPIKYESAREDKTADHSLYDQGDHISRALFLPGANWQALLDNSESIWITEGAKKAGALISVGCPAICLFGVWNGQKEGTLIPELELFAKPGRRFVLAFDNDLYEKKNVLKALNLLAGLLTERGALVSVASWDREFKGVDDFLASLDKGARSEAMHDDVTVQPFQEWRKALKQEKETADGQEDGNASKLSGKLSAPDTIRLMSEIYNDRLRYNVRAQQVELDGSPVRLEHLYLDLAEQYGAIVRKELAADAAMRHGLKSEYDPIHEYLQRVERTVKPANIDRLAEQFLGVAGDDFCSLYNTYLKRWLVAAVKRVFEPGSKFDNCLVLQGGQGTGKSTFFRVLASDEFFTESVRDVTRADDLQILYSAWIAEMPEIEVSISGKHEHGAIKRFFSAQEDKLRPAYGRERLNFPRRSVIGGSTNADEFLGDVTGNRRFWVIPVQGSIDVVKLAKFRDQIWAGAIAAYRSGVDVFLNETEAASQRVANRRWEYRDPWETPVMEFAASQPYVTVLGCLKQVEVSLDRADQRSARRIAHILTRNGWEQRGQTRMEGTRIRAWYPVLSEDQASLVEVCDETLELDKCAGYSPVSDSVSEIPDTAGTLTSTKNVFLNASKLTSDFRCEDLDQLSVPAPDRTLSNPVSDSITAGTLTKNNRPKTGAPEWQYDRAEKTEALTRDALLDQIKSALDWARSGVTGSLQAAYAHYQDFIFENIEVLPDDALTLLDLVL